MCEARRGYVVLLQGGDPEISGALAAGTLTAIEARGDEEPHPALRATFPTGGRLLEDQRRVVSAEMDRQAIREGLREAVGNHKTAEDYAAMRCRAEIEWGEPVDFPSPLRKLGDGLLAAYAMVICGLSAAFHAQDHILGG